MRSTFRKELLPAKLGVTGLAPAIPVALFKQDALFWQVVPSEAEPTEVTLKKFSSAVRRTGMYYEVGTALSRPGPGDALAPSCGRRG